MAPNLMARRAQIRSHEVRNTCNNSGFPSDPFWSFEGFETWSMSIWGIMRWKQSESKYMETSTAPQCYAGKMHVQTNRRAHAFSAREALCFLFPPLPCFLEFKSFSSAGSMSLSSAVIVCSFLPVNCLFPCSLY